MCRVPRPTVLFVDHSAALSGAEIFLARCLDGAVGIHPIVLLFDDGPLRHRLQDLGVEVRVTPLSKRLAGVQSDAPFSWRAIVGSARELAGQVASVRSSIREVDASLVYTNSVKAHIIAGIAARLAFRNHLMHVHEHMTRTNFSQWQYRLLRIVAVALPHRILVNSVSTRETLPRRAQRRAIVQACPIPSPPQETTKQEPRSFVVGVVGRLSEGKGQHVAIESMRLVREQQPHVQMRVVGGAEFTRDKEYADYLVRLVAAERLTKCVRFTGRTDDVWQVLSQIDVLVIPSVKPEGFCQVLVEGMAAGLAVIAPDAGGPAEIVTNGRDGLLFDPGNTAQLAARICMLVDQPSLRLRLGQNARRTALRFAPSVVQPAWEQLLLESCVD